MEWEITGHESTAEIFRDTVPGSYGAAVVCEILRRLASRHLIDYEIVEASTGKRSALDVRSLGGGSFTCGNNPYYIARLRR